MSFRIVFVILFLFAGLANAELHLKFLGQEELPQVEFAGKSIRVHTQGLWVTEDHYLVTGRLESEQKRALLIRFNRSDLGSYEILDMTPEQVGEETLDHPGGFDRSADGRYWIPLSTSHRRGPSLICEYVIDPDKPLADAKLVSSFESSDHIGAVCCSSEGVIAGANWDTKDVHFWEPRGEGAKKVSSSDLFSPDWKFAVQDWKSFDAKRKLVVFGAVQKASLVKRNAVVGIAALEEGKLVDTAVLEARRDVTRPLTNEGLAIYEGQLFLLPEDIGAGAKVLRFEVEGL